MTMAKVNDSFIDTVLEMSEMQLEKLNQAIFVLYCYKTGSKWIGEPVVLEQVKQAMRVLQTEDETDD
jgi:hypothetical protein